MFVATLEDLTSSKKPELATNLCEVIWVRIELKGRQTLLTCSFYYPHTGDRGSIKAFDESTHMASRTNNTSIVVGEDFNLPGWHWPIKTLKKGTPYPQLHRKFMDDIQDMGLEQIVQEPTRGDSVPDLFLTNLQTWPKD